VSCFVIHKYGNGKQRLLVAAVPCASSPFTQSQRVHTKDRRTPKWTLLRNRILLCKLLKTQGWIALRPTGITTQEPLMQDIHMEQRSESQPFHGN
jgi:hypothetical protein